MKKERQSKLSEMIRDVGREKKEVTVAVIVRNETGRVPTL